MIFPLLVSLAAETSSFTRILRLEHPSLNSRLAKVFCFVLFWFFLLTSTLKS